MLRKLILASFKRVYRFNQWTRRRFTSTGMLILLIMPVAGVFGFDTRSTLSFQIFSITLTLLITSMFFAVFFRGKFSIDRKLPEYGSVGTPLNYACIIRNENKTAKRGIVLIDELKNQFPSIEMFSKTKDPLDKNRNRIDRFIGYPRLVNAMQKLRGGTIKPIAVDYIAEKSEIEATLQLTPLRRGYLQFDKTRLAMADPLGLFQGQKIIHNKDRLLILPKLYKTPRLNLQGKRSYHHGGVNNASIVGDSQEFTSLRDYHPGDPIRSIHWRSFAKLNKPIVKEYQDEYFTRYGLILDTFLDKQPELIFEDAVSIAASFMTSQKEQDALLDLMFVGNKSYRFTSGRGLAGAENILEVLACVQPVYESNIPEVELMIHRYSRECSAFICILLELDEQRLKLIKALSELNIPIKLFLLKESSNTASAETENEIHVIHHDNLQQDLDALWTT
tara:strand:+ start:347 stop:1690 length:1344 start_codon:yes stop_codon:yes gene_type:complete